MKETYSAASLIRHGLSGHKKWKMAWRSPDPKPAYDVIIVGGGGHGLATAYYLARNHGIRNIAVLEQAWIGGGNTGRNTTVIRSNYFYPESAHFYDFSLRLYEKLSQELNFNIMFSQRGVWVLAHSKHDVEILRRSMNAMRLNGVDAEFHNESGVRKAIPILNASPRHPVVGGLLQPRAGTARHDAVAWGYARAADALGVDIIQNCAVTALDIENGAVAGLETSRGYLCAGKIGLAVAGNSSIVARMAGLGLPIKTYALQAYVSEPVKPVLDTVVLSPATGVYVSQSDKGELVIGAGLDLYPSYAQRGRLATMEHAAAGVIDISDRFSRLRFLRQWAGTVDVVHDSSPIIGKTSIAGLYINCGWGTGGFKAIPGGGYCFAATIANDSPHELIAPFGLDRFKTGAMVDEAAASGISH